VIAAKNAPDRTRRDGAESERSATDQAGVGRSGTRQTRAGKQTIGIQQTGKFVDFDEVPSSFGVLLQKEVP